MDVLCVFSYIYVQRLHSKRRALLFFTLSLAVALHGQQDIALRMEDVPHRVFLINLKKQTMQLEFCSKLAS